MADAKQKLIKKVDTAFSKYIRKRDSRNGVIQCCTCPGFHAINEVDAGHYISRSVMCTRWDEQNVHAQCKKCNYYREGMKDVYRKFLIDLYGVEVVETLERARYQTCVVSTVYLQGLLAEYKEKEKVLDESGSANPRLSDRIIW